VLLQDATGTLAALQYLEPRRRTGDEHPLRPLGIRGPGLTGDQPDIRRVEHLVSRPRNSLQNRERDCGPSARRDDREYWWYLREEQRSDRAAGAIEFQRISGTGH
jgi:hypothetical protein